MAAMAKTGLVLTGGGARGAYQAGFLRGMADIVPIKNLPFPIITGCSVGAINAAYLACFAHDFKEATERLCHMWATIKPEGVFVPKKGAFFRIALNWLGHVVLKQKAPLITTLMDNLPLKKMLQSQLDFDAIRACLKARHLQAVAFTAMDYNRRLSTCFFESADDASGWHKKGSVGKATTLSVDHVVGSAGLPLLFEPVKIGDSYFGDGSIKLMSPLRPALRLGAERILVISTYSLSREVDNEKDNQPELCPSFGSIIAAMLQSVFSDALDVDLERLKEINNFIKEQNANRNFRYIPALEIKPSTDLSSVVADCCHSFPRSFMKFLGLIGGLENDHTFLSYLSFEPSFTKKLLELGYEDAIKRKSEILTFMQ